MIAEMRLDLLIGRKFRIGDDESPALIRTEIIGQDGTGKLEYNLPAQMDEFIMTADVLSEADIANLKAYYGN